VAPYGSGPRSGGPNDLTPAGLGSIPGGGDAGGGGVEDGSDESAHGVVRGGGRFRRERCGGAGACERGWPVAEDRRWRTGRERGRARVRPAVRPAARRYWRCAWSPAAGGGRRVRLLRRWTTVRLLRRWTRCSPCAAANDVDRMTVWRELASGKTSTSWASTRVAAGQAAAASRSPAAIRRLDRGARQPGVAFLLHVDLLLSRDPTTLALSAASRSARSGTGSGWSGGPRCSPQRRRSRRSCSRPC
jgi:hypothetical protein